MIVLITIHDIRKKFEELIGKTKSREEIANWANERMQDEDLGRLVYLPEHSDYSLA